VREWSQSKDVQNGMGSFFVFSLVFFLLCAVNQKAEMRDWVFSVRSGITTSKQLGKHVSQHQLHEYNDPASIGIYTKYFLE